MFDYAQSQKYESGFHSFVETVFDHEDVLSNHEVKYIKNNCRGYPKELDKYREYPIQKLMEEVNSHSYRKKTKKEREAEKIKWGWSKNTGGMFEEPNKAGMFEFEEELDRIDQFDE